MEGENHKRETDCCFRPFSSLPSFHRNSLAANGGEDWDERRKEERRKGPLLSLLSLLSSSFHQGGNAFHPIFRQVKKQSTFFFRPCLRLGSTGVIVVLLGQTSSRFSLCCFVIYVSLCPPLKKACKTSRLPDYGVITFARF